MTLIVEDSTRRLSVKRSHGRVANEIAALLEKRLSVPEIYIKPRIPGPTGVDVLAVDQAGSGDFHGVEIEILPILPTRSGIRQILAPLKTLPVHFKYIAVQANEASRHKWLELRDYDELFETSGIGRIGVITFDERLLQKNSEFDAGLISLIVRPERYLVRGPSLLAMERFLKKERPDIRVRL